MTLFETVKACVSTREAAEFYGIEVDCHNKALCPFHDDHNPSLYVDDTHYHCFACQVHGDTVSLVAGLFGLSNTDAARKLAADFHLDTDKPLPELIKQKLRIQTEAQRLRENEKLCFSVLAEYRQVLCEWKITHAPKSSEDESDKRFSEACKYLDWVEYHLDLLIMGDSHDRTKVVNYLMEDSRAYRLKRHIAKTSGKGRRYETEIS